MEKEHDVRGRNKASYMDICQNPSARFNNIDTREQKIWVLVTTSNIHTAASSQFGQCQTSHVVEPVDRA